MTEQRWSRVRFAAAEFVVIVAGVLVALGVDEWRQSRRDHALELQYAARLRADLQRDTTRFADFERTALAVKADVLMSLMQRAGGRAAPPSAASVAGGSEPPSMQALFYSQFIALPEAQSALCGCYLLDKTLQFRNRSRSYGENESATSNVA
jgi:hypothetical protein